jgi:hypothetical protein
MHLDRLYSNPRFGPPSSHQGATINLPINPLGPGQHQETRASAPQGSEFRFNDAANSTRAGGDPQFLFAPQPPSAPAQESDSRTVLSNRQHSPQWGYGTFKDRNVNHLSQSSYSEPVGTDPFNLSSLGSSSGIPSGRTRTSREDSSSSVTSGRTRTLRGGSSGPLGTRLSGRVLSKPPHASGKSRESSTPTPSTSPLQFIEYGQEKRWSRDELWKRIRNLVYERILQQYYPKFSDADARLIVEVALEDCRRSLPDVPESK